MPFKVIEHIVGAEPGSGPAHRRVLQDGISELAAAEEAAEAASKTQTVYGYNKENHHWWGRNHGSGARRIYHVEGEP